MRKLEKGKSTPLNVTQKARHRIYVGLGWDPAQKAGMIDKVSEIMGGKKTYHDLDLSCFIYDKDKNHIDTVSPHSDKFADNTAHIYHSGDDREGFGDGDDEQISVELKDMDPSIHHMVFVTTIKSGHNFSEIESPKIRVADGYSEHSFLKMTMDDKDAADNSSFIFASIQRSDHEWLLHYIGTYLKKQEVKNWEEKLKEYLP